MSDIVTAFQDFLATGGHVLYAILFLTIGLWWAMIDRFWYFQRDYPLKRAEVLSVWNNLADKESWFGESRRRQLISQLDCALAKNIKLIQSMIALLPMLGLLGTVTGMIQVFEVLAVTGSSNPRSMADGVSAATIPTMAGMVAALVALPISSRIEKMYQQELHKIADDMPSEKRAD